MYMLDGGAAASDLLSEIDQQIRGKPPDERYSMRQAQVVPLLYDMKPVRRDTFHALCEIGHVQGTPKPAIHKESASHTHKN